MQSKLNTYTQEIEETLKRLSKRINSEKSDKLKKYLGTQLSVFGLDSKTQIQLCKNGYSFHTNNHESTFKIYNSIYKYTKNFETKNQAYLYLDKHYKFISKQTQFSILPSWVKQIDNWAHSDLLSKFLTRLLEDKETQQEMMQLIEQWNSSKNPWERRQSLVSLFYYSRTKNSHIEYKISEKLIHNVINDDDYYVQKAIGWALRESYNVYPQKTFAYINKHVKTISSTAFTTCIEKMNIEKKNSLKLQRK